MQKYVFERQNAVGQRGGEAINWSGGTQKMREYAKYVQNMRKYVKNMHKMKNLKICTKYAQICANMRSAYFPPPADIQRLYAK